MNYYYGMVWLLGLFLWQSPLYSQSVNLDSFQKIQLMSLEECAVVQVNASWNYANRLKIEKLKDCYIAEIDLANKNIGEVIPLNENSGLIIQSSFGIVVLFAPEATKYNPWSP